MSRPARVESLQPRPVPGPREYSLQFDVRGGLAPYEIHKDLLRGFEEAGGEVVAKPGPVESVLAFPGLVEGDHWAASVAAEGVPSGVRVRLRLRPQHVTEYNFWPPDKLRAPVRSLLTGHACFVGQERAEGKAKDISAEAVTAFVRDVLRGKDRTLPVIVLTPGPWGSPEEAQALAADLIGIAQVHRLATPGGTFELTAQVGGKERSVYGGAVRIYRPGFDPTDDPLDHDLLVPRYIETRLLGGRSLAAELARRILPMAAAPIPLPSTPAPAAPPVTSRAALPAPVSPVARLEGEVRELRTENRELREEIRRLKEGLQAALTRFEELEYLIPTTTDPGLPWPLLNPRGREVELAPSFVDQLAAVAKDGSLAAEVKKKMEAVLLDPEGYGKDMRGKRKGQRATYVARNYRLVWSVEGLTVRFVLIVSKEDPEYSPFGA